MSQAPRPAHYSEVRRLAALQQRRASFAALSDDAYTESEEPRPNNKKAKRREQVLVPAGLDTYPWATEFVNWARADVGSWAILAIVTVVVGVFPWWILQWVYSLPQALMRYGAVQYFVLGVLYFFNVILVKISSAVEFYQLALGLNVAGLVLEIWLAVVIIYNFYACHAGIYPVECKNNYQIDLLMAIPTFLLLFAGFASCTKLSYIVFRTSNTTPPVFIRLTNRRLATTTTTPAGANKKPFG